MVRLAPGNRGKGLLPNPVLFVRCTPRSPGSSPEPLCLSKELWVCFELEFAKLFELIILYSLLFTYYFLVPLRPREHEWLQHMLSHQEQLVWEWTSVPWLVHRGPCRFHLLPAVRFQVRSVLLPWAVTYDIGNISALIDTHLSAALHPDPSLS